jgi:hypothetical protein
MNYLIKTIPDKNNLSKHLKVSKEDILYLPRFNIIWDNGNGKAWVILDEEDGDEKGGKKSVKWLGDVIALRMGIDYKVRLKNSDILDYRRGNILPLTDRPVKRKSRYPGVTYDSLRLKWVCQKTYKGVKILYERYDREDDAYKRYLEVCEEVKKGKYDGLYGGYNYDSR